MELYTLLETSYQVAKIVVAALLIGKLFYYAKVGHVTYTVAYGVLTHIYFFVLVAQNGGD